MADLLTALGIMLVLGVGAWYLGSLLLRVAAFWCFVGAGLLLLVAGQGDVSPWAGPALFGWGVSCWALAHCLHRVRRGWWRSPLAGRLFSGRLPRRRPRPRGIERPEGTVHGRARPR
jgi:hypothetical protein